jgi:hypothetical protein
MMMFILGEAYITQRKKPLVVGTKEFALDVNADKTKYIDMSRDQNARKNHNIGKQVINRSRMWNRSDNLKKY